MIPFNGKPEINWAVMVRRKQSASVMEGCFLLFLAHSSVHNDWQWAPKRSWREWQLLAFCGTSLPFVYGTHWGICCHQSSSCLPLSNITITDMSTAACMQEVYISHASQQHHTFKNKQRKVTAWIREKCAAREIKQQQQQEKAHIQWWIFFFVHPRY